MDKPFHGRLFIEGSPSPDCSARFDGQKNFTWPVPLSAEPCGTVYDGNGEFANTVTLQHHEVLVTKNDRRYRVNCKYDLGIINVTSSAFTVMSPVQTSYITSNITLTSLPPNLTIGITDLLGNQLQSAVLGDTLMFSIAVPENGSYGIAAKNCYAFGAKENERMQLTDDTGCPVLPEFFRPFKLNGKTLQAEFDAFRFRNSYVITYQCTVNYCLDSCPQPSCTDGNSTGQSRTKRETNYIGTYNLRKQLQIEDSTDATGISTSGRGSRSSPDVCMTNSLMITLAVFVALFMILSVVLLIVAIKLHRRQHRKMRCRTFSGTSVSP
ncbi:hypothetical protein BV898_17285 [Hypsibius exemplaris]|uniref:ZP domain-containing protein n=1 Tax=Hypsibius exemplaris TaxID=2072580 RepID=A0A9X6NGZ6_HYPEX|nr:hypothetical protein BV898_17285 [Hypsibius exemplaris]